MRKLLIPCLALAVLLAACQRKAEQQAPAPKPPAPTAAPAETPPAPAPPKGYSHAAGLDQFGYYMPQSDVMFGNYRLRNLHVGSAEELAAYERGQSVSPAYAPVMLEFEDVSPAEEGGDQPRAVRRVLPDSYELTATTVRFRGHDEVLGEVVFEGQFDTKALARVRSGGGDEAVLKGVVSAMRQRLTRSFTWFGGD